jgi:hypothetical protein
MAGLSFKRGLTSPPHGRTGDARGGAAGFVKIDATNLVIQFF